MSHLEAMPPADLFATGNSYLGLVRQSGASHQEQVVVARALLKRGHAIDGALTKIFRKKSPPFSTTRSAATCSLSPNSPRSKSST